MKLFNLILAALFLGFAVLQFNDDPTDIIFWVLIYAGVAAISAFAAFNKYNMWVIVLGIGAIIYKLFVLFPGISRWVDDGMPSIVGSMKASSPHIELVREFLGLVICFVVLVFHYVRYSKVRKASEP